MKTINITQARKNIFNLVDEATQFSEPILITGKKHNAVLISQEDWDALQETLYLISIPGFVEGIKEAEKEPDEELTKLEEIDWNV
jgi:prevent-host-death family protein